MITFESPEKMVEVLSQGVTEKYAATLKLNIYNYCASELAKTNTSLSEEIKQLKADLEESKEETTTVATQIQTLTTTINNLTQTVTTLEGTVGTLNTNLTSLTERVTALETPAQDPSQGSE